jgi:hypothetical protein
VEILAFHDTFSQSGHDAQWKNLPVSPHFSLLRREIPPFHQFSAAEPRFRSPAPNKILLIWCGHNGSVDAAPNRFSPRSAKALPNTGELSKLSHYRLRDNFIRFYLRYVAPNKPRIEKGLFDGRSIFALAGLDSVLALQFETLVLNNSPKVIERIGIPLEDVVFTNPFFQRQTRVQRGCQIDLAVQTRFNTVYVCEIKFSKAPVKPAVVDEVAEKLNRLKLPRHVSARPVLIHVNGVHPAVIESRFFSRIIDFGELLTA